MIHLTRLDHIVLTVANIEQSCAFYSRVLGMKIEIFGHGRKGLSFGNQKINLHEHGREFDPKARNPRPGSADLCFITETSLEEAMAHLKRCGVPIELGPVERTGASGMIRSVYLRDPDLNLIEIANEV
jgi:catechol 2,3-dioxygenase-like lactoylglutathione lyase family enzyme